MKTIETERLILREWEKSDLDDFFEYSKNPNVGPNAGWTPHENKSVSLEILNSFIERKDTWALVYKSNGKVIGSIGLHEDKKRETKNVKKFGYVLAEDYWGKGLMTEAVNRMLDHAFQELKLDLVSIYHYLFNLRSKSVIQKAGFHFEGILRKTSVGYDGSIYDDYCYSMTKEDYMLKHS